MLSKLENLQSIEGFIEQRPNPSSELLKNCHFLKEDYEYEQLPWWKKLFNTPPKYRRGDW